MSQEQEQDPNSYHRFAEMINEVNDLEMLNVAESLMNDMATINNMRQKIEMLEEKLHEGDRAAFYFFTLSLSPDEIAAATSTVKGRKRVVTEKQERAAKAKAEAAEAAEAENSEE